MIAGIYQEIMDGKTETLHLHPVMMKLLSDKVNEVAMERLRDTKVIVGEAMVEEDLDEALKRSKLVEAHVFHIMAPPSLSLASLETNRPLCQNQSILKHSARPIDDVIMIARCFNVQEPIRKVIPLDVERLVMHNLIRRFVLEFSLNGELSEELIRVIPSLSQTVFQASCKRIAPLRDELQEQALNYLQGRSQSIDSKFQRIIDELACQTQSGSNSPGEIQRAIAMRTADLIIEDYVQEEVNKFELAGSVELQGYKPLPMQTRQTRRIFMINGGVASGKSSAQLSQSERARAEGVEWSDICPINRDAFKPVLLSRDQVDPGFQDYFASFTEDEAYLLRDAVLREYQVRLENDTAPHLYIDQVSPSIEMLRMAGAPEGRGLDLTIVQTPVENSFMMAFGRERRTGYGAVTQGVLSTHAKVPMQLLSSLSTAVDEQKTNIRVNIVANVAIGVIQPVACIDLASGRGQIQDPERLLAFFHKSHINQQATRFDELYAPGLPVPSVCCRGHLERFQRYIKVSV